MKRPRFVFGRRGDAFGVFVSPPGVDASTADVSNLSLHINSAMAQIAIQGVSAGPFPTVIPHSLGYAPIVIPNLISTDLVGGTFGYVRPFDNAYPPYTNSYAKSEAAQFTLFQTGPALSINYFVLNRSLS